MCVGGLAATLALSARVGSAAASRPPALHQGVEGVSGWDKAGVVIAALAALLTLAAVAVALFGPAWWERRRRPQLKLCLSDATVETETEPSGPGVRALYQRLLVANAEKKDDAEDVQLIIERLSSDPSDVHLRIPLIWTHSEPRATKTTIPSGYAMLVDLLAVRADQPNCLVLQVHPQPAGGQHRLFAPGAARTQAIEAVLLARGVPHSRWRIEVEYDGAWNPSAEPGNHLHVMPIRTE